MDFGVAVQQLAALEGVDSQRLPLVSVLTSMNMLANLS